MSSCEVPIILVRFQWNLDLLDSFSKNTQIPNFMKIHPVGAELFHADGHMDRRMDGRAKVKVTFHNFANAHTQTTEHQRITHLTNATPLGMPVSLSFKRFFCTICPYFPNSMSRYCSVMLLHQHKTKLLQEDIHNQIQNNILNSVNRSNVHYQALKCQVIID
jgi:hypothetical protein